MAPATDVGVDVVGLAAVVGADGGHDRDELVGEQAVEDRRVDRRDVADEAELRVAGSGTDQAGVLAADPDGVVAVQVDRRDQLRVDLSDEHHAGDVDGLGIGDPQAVAELGGLAEALHQGADLRAAAMDDDGTHADESHQHDVLGEQLEGVVLGGAGEGVAAVLDDDRLAGEPADVRQAPRPGRGRPSLRSPATQAEDGRSLAGARSLAAVDGSATHGDIPTSGRPRASSRPRATLADCRAPPDAPLVRLSRAHKATAVPVRSS